MGKNKLTVGSRGLRLLKEEIRRAAKQYEEAFARAIFEEGLKVDALAVRKTPVDTGRLRATHYVAPPEQRGDEYVVEVGNGTDYAVFVHERTDQAHRVGEAKFLEKALGERAEGFTERVAARTEVNAKRGLGLVALPGNVPEKPANIPADATKDEIRKAGRKG